MTDKAETTKTPEEIAEESKRLEEFLNSRDDGKPNLELLLPDERALLEQDIDAEATYAVDDDEEAEEDTTTNDDEDDLGEEGEDDGEEKPEEVPATDDDKTAEENGDGEEDASNAEELAALRRVQRPTAPEGLLIGKELEAKLEALNSELDQAQNDYDEGSLTPEELRAKQKEIIDQRVELAANAKAYTQQANAYQEAQKTLWVAACDSYSKQFPALFEQNSATRTAFDAMVRSMAQSGLYGENMEGLLVAAHRSLEAQADVLGLEVPASKKAATNKKPTPTTNKTPAQKPKPAEPPVTLKDVPGGADTDTSGSVFEQLDALAQGDDITAYESALNRLSSVDPVAYDNYMAR